MTSKNLRFGLRLVMLLWFGTGLAFLVWSYALVDGNLVLSRLPIYWQTQQWLWRHLLTHRQWLSLSYSLITLLAFLSWILLVWILKKINWVSLATWKVVLGYIVLVSPFILAYNALSYDVFNYIFNARMVLVYHVNPHVKTALDFYFDPWTRFMHNVHTPAPYGYGWTALSLLPYGLGFGKFTLTWLMFKLFSLLSLIWLFFNLRWLGRLLKLKVYLWQWAVLFFNPLLVIEILSNAHNDLWMMNLLLLATSLVISQLQSQSIHLGRHKLDWRSTLGLSLVAFGFAGWIKLASLVTGGWYGLLFLVGWFNQQKPSSFIGRFVMSWLQLRLKSVLQFTPLIFSSLLFLLLLTDRSRRFLPWYLTWSLVFLPLLLATTNKMTFGIKKLNLSQLDRLPHFGLNWALFLIAFSISSLFHYLPWIRALSYDGDVIRQQRLVTWSVGLGLFGVFYWLKRRGCLLRFLFNKIKNI